MDLSKEYILMCEKAKEIQELSRKEQGQYAYYAFDNHVSCCVNQDEAKAIARRFNDKFIFLPRQDQLQEMIKGDKDWYHLLCYFGEWFEYYGCSNIHSIEQAWLEYLMQVKFNKTWNGEDWVNNG